MDFDPFDTRRYRTVSVTDGYRAWARTYDRSMGPQLDIDLLAPRAWLDGRSIHAAADLACGTGRIGAWLASRGVRHVDGVDLTPSMLAHAHRRGVYRSLLVGDMTAVPLASAGYDLVICVLAVEHLPDLAPVYREAARLGRRNAASRGLTLP